MSDFDDRLRRQLMSDEGSRRIVFPGLSGFPPPPHGSYLDTSKPPKWTTGYGFNLEDPSAPAALAKVTTKAVAKLISREELLTETEALQLLDAKIADATKLARNKVKSFDKLSDARKLVVVCMAYQLKSFGDFTNFFSAIEKSDFSGAAEEMKKSLWYHQTPNRVNRLYDAMRNDQYPPQSAPRPQRQHPPAATPPRPGTSPARPSRPEPRGADGPPEHHMPNHSDAAPPRPEPPPPRPEPPAPRPEPPAAHPEPPPRPPHADDHGHGTGGDGDGGPVRLP